MLTFITASAFAAGHPVHRSMKQFPAYAFFYKPQTDADYAHAWMHNGEPEDDERPLVDAINAFVAKYYNGTTPFTLSIDDVTREVRAELLQDTPAPVLVYHRYDERVGTLVRKGDALTLPYAMELLPLDKMPSSVFVPEDVVVAHVRASIFPKPRKEARGARRLGEAEGEKAKAKAVEGPVGPLFGAEPLEGADIRARPIELEDTIVLPAGTYFTVAELAQALNGSFKKRAKRGGQLLFEPARKRKVVLRLVARTRTNAIAFEATPTEAGRLLGLMGNIKVDLGAKRFFIDFHGLPSGLIM
jgi:hypothetical protein